jgi:hypothetical protein
MSTIIVGGWVNKTATALRGGSTRPLRGGSAEPTATRVAASKRQVGGRNRYAAVSGLTASHYAASDYVSGTQIRGKFYRSALVGAPFHM